MIVAGWADGYRNNTFRTVARLACRGGCWPGRGATRTRRLAPGPHIDAVVEMVALLRRAPARRPAVGRSRRRRCSCAARPARSPTSPMHPGVWRRCRRRGRRPAGAERVTPCRRRRRAASTSSTSSATSGSTAWISCAGSLPWGQPLDQRADDARSLTYDWPVDRAGRARRQRRRCRCACVRRRRSPTSPRKLCDVFPDGTSALITRGMLNLTPPRSLAGRRRRRGRRGHRHRSSRASGWTSPSSSRRRRGRSSPATGCGWRIAGTRLAELLAAADAGAPRRRPGDASSSTLPAVGRRAGVGARRSRPATDHGRSTTDVVWRIEHDVLGRETPRRHPLRRPRTTARTAPWSTTCYDGRGRRVDRPIPAGRGPSGTRRTDRLAGGDVRQRGHARGALRRRRLRRRRSS